MKRQRVESTDIWNNSAKRSNYSAEKLPPELRRILNLRLTARNERKLVGSVKMLFTVNISRCLFDDDEDEKENDGSRDEDNDLGCCYHFEGDIQVGSKYHTIKPDLLGINRTLSFLGYVVKYHDVHELTVSDYPDIFWPAVLHQIVENRPMRVKHLELDLDVKTNIKILEAIDPKFIETAEVNCAWRGRRPPVVTEQDLIKITKMPAILRAKSVYFLGPSVISKLPSLLALEWMKNDVPVWTRLCVYSTNCLAHFHANHALKIIDCTTAGTIRLQSENPEKHIIVTEKILFDKTVMMMVPAGLKEEEEMLPSLEHDGFFCYGMKWSDI